MLAVCCRTDFGGAVITGADFTNALVDKSQQIVSQHKQQDLSWHATPFMASCSSSHHMHDIEQLPVAWQTAFAQLCV